jgi:metal-responsive CopG/Arc/MetJ family transcriptional regulator
MSLPEALLNCIDNLVMRRGFPSRSHTIAVIVGKYLTEHKEVAADEISTGTITLLHGENDVTKQLGLICARYPAEIKSRTSVAVCGGQMLEVLLVHGLRARLRALEQELDRLRGVTFAKASICAAGVGRGATLAVATPVRTEVPEHR